MKLVKDIKGERFNRLTALAFIRRHFRPSGQYRDVWLFGCDCGNEVEIFSYSVTSGRTKSCGCYRTEKTRERSLTHGQRVNRTYTRLITIWTNILQRCNNPNYREYYLYGGRGIKCLWTCFEDFKRDMGPTYAPHLTIDRWPDKNGNYCKENCRWATPKQQANNTRRNRLENHNGETKTFSEWCDVFGIKYSTVTSRITRGMSFSEALTTPVKTTTPIV